jgi:cysteinyl-tRNA synthetase
MVKHHVGPYNQRMDIRLYNTAKRALEAFSPPPPHEVTMYHCGPTVYNYAHIGNLRAYVFADILRRMFEANGYTVRQVINITDVGHLVGDGDEGEDKISVGAKREGTSVEEIITRYSNAFYDDLAALGIKAVEGRGKEECFPRATHHIEEQKDLIEELARKGFTYVTTGGIYFDTAKFPTYAEFARLDIGGLSAGARVNMAEKRRPTDFALWKFSPEGGAKREQEWDSPLGIARKGFPGWHIECSAMSRKYLGQPFDIHTGGIDHIPVHHTNEIAQSEAAYGVPLARYWMHSAFMTVDGQKMSKSLGNTYRLVDLAERGIPALAYRYWLLTAHYRTTVNVTWDALAGAHAAYNRLTDFMLKLPDDVGSPIEPYMREFMDSVNDDLNTASALATLWKLLKDDSQRPDDVHATILAFDRVLGLDIADKRRLAKSFVVPKEVTNLLAARQAARERKEFAESDRLREEIKKLGYDVKDTPEGQKLSPV